MLFFVIIFYFNSRLYMRGSISAAQHLACSIHFNSRLYMRGSLIESHFCSVCQFQFTPLHERQRLLSAFRSSLRYFNSRLYMRGSFQVFQLCLCHLFQFTPLHERQLQKYTIFSIKSTQFSTKPCFFIVTSRKVVFFSIPVQYFL